MTFQTCNFKKNKTPLWLSIAALFATGLITASVAHAQTTTPATTEPAQEPLIMAGGTSATPNIMIVYDDSGSMNNVAIPDDAAPMHYVSLHPEDIGLSNNMPYTQFQVIPTGENELAAALIRSHQINPLYYNPATTYEPWKGADGKPIVERDKIKPENVPTYASIFLRKLPPRNTYIDLTEVKKIYPFDGFYFRDRRRAYCAVSSRPPILDCELFNNLGSYEFTPAVYFIYKGSDAGKPDFSKWSTTNPHILKITNYKRISIMEDITPLGITQKDSRTDCTSLPSSGAGFVQCSREEELQNFAVWYIFYRDRIRAATGALSQVFSQDFDVKFRLAWTALNKTSIQGVREFGLDTRHAANFFNWIFSFEIDGAVGSTPTLSSLARAGDYFMGEEPWYDDPASPNATKPMLACRRNYTILMTDGGWNDYETDGSSWISPDGVGSIIETPNKSKKYTYSGLKTDGTKNYPYYDGNGTNLSLAKVAHHFWATDLKPKMPNILSGTGYDGNAFWQNMVTHTVGFGVSGLLDYPADWEALQAGTKPWSNPAGKGGSEPGKIDDLWHAAVTGHGTYASAANLTDLIKSLSSILANIATGEVRSPYSTVLTDNLSAANNMIYMPQYTAGKWAGELFAYPIKEVSTGIEISPTAKWKASEKIPAHDSRNIFVGVDKGKGEGVETVDFTWGDISSELKDYLNKDKKLLDFLRGDTTRNSDYRARDGALGDIINSGPVVIQERANLGYTQFVGYQKYRTSMKARAGMIFVGANDGMLHGFDLETGVEKFAYIPYGITQKLSKLAAKDYDANHAYYVDGPLVATDVNWGAEWKNILIGTAGAGGKSVFAIDVTNESKYTDSAAVLWDISDKTTGLERMGNIMQPIQTGYAKTGDWVGIFGNGAYGKDGHAIFYVVNLKTGALEKEITVDTAGENGLMSVTLVKDKNQEIIEAYGADLKGNLWRVNFNSVQYNTWGSPHKLFTTANGRAITQTPITKAHPKGGRMVVFGTGKFFDEADRDTDTGTDALYGIWDKGGSDLVTTDDLIKRTVVAIPGTDGKYFHLTGDLSAINWNTQLGWTLPLTMADKQRSLYSPRPLGNDVFFDTTLTTISASAAESCEVEGLKGITLLLDLFGGGKPAAKWNVAGLTGDVVGIYNPNDGRGQNLIGGLVPGGSDPDPDPDGWKNKCRSGGGVPSVDINNNPICAPATDFYSWVTLR